VAEKRGGREKLREGRERLASLLKLIFIQYSKMYDIKSTKVHRPLIHRYVTFLI